MKKKIKESLEKHVVTKSLSFSTFEVFEALVVRNSVSVALICLCRPTHGKQNKNTNKMFLDKFPDFLHSLSDSTGDVIVMKVSDFHLDNQHDCEVCK